ncbi:MAG: UbiA family prenyltransferase [Gammaproteobacteria bacterium]|nr:UbiA family prenyltransferase [Gammaproteobacteria bacterium]NND55579.1 UbiA family prenyltransferase [Gammaproteobacteria bacterium]
MTTVGEHDRAPPLIVDLDGTLIRTDLLHESVFGLLKQNPFNVLKLPFWLLRGKAHMKEQIAQRVAVRVDLLPYNDEFLSYLREEHAAGRTLVLATASNQRYARGVAEHLGIFSEVLSSDEARNLSGPRKLQHIESLIPEGQFAYAGNASVDVPIWQHAAAAVLVSPSSSTRSQAESIGNVERVFENNSRRVVELFRAIRPHQWLKNLLVFVPLVLSHQIDNLSLVVNCIIAFAAFSFCASSVYLLNDLLDLDSDRQHPRKCRRPFAAGSLPVTVGVVAMCVLLIIAVGLAMVLPPLFLPALIFYYAMTLAYSIWLKKAALVDGLTLAALYTMRLIAGAAAIAVMPSFWMLAFSMFIFLSLAFIKRYSELLTMGGAGAPQKLAGRGYKPVDMETVAQLGTASGYLAVLVLALYINGDKVDEMYARPEALWMLCPMMLYWVSRMWLLTRRGDMHDDPVVFTIRDVRTWWLAVLTGGALLTSIFWAQVRPFLPLPG